MAEVLIRPKNVSEEQWSKAVQLYNVAKNRGDRYPELTVAQAALETGWFKSPAGQYNYFGQKATASQKGSTKSTREASNNSYYRTSAKFRDYDSLEEAVDDRIKKWGSKYSNADNIDEAIGSIWRYNPKTGSGEGYATDINYGSKIKNILGSMGISSSKSNPQNDYQPSYDERPIGDYFADGTVRLNQNSGEYMTAPDFLEIGESKEDAEGESAKNELRQAQQEKDFIESIFAQQQSEQEAASQNYAQDQAGYQLYNPELPEYQAQQAPSYFKLGGVMSSLDKDKLKNHFLKFEEGGDFVEAYDTEGEKPKKPLNIPKFEYKKKTTEDILREDRQALLRTSTRDNIPNFVAPVKKVVETNEKVKSSTI